MGSENNRDALGRRQVLDLAARCGLKTLGGQEERLVEFASLAREAEPVPDEPEATIDNAGSQVHQSSALPSTPAAGEAVRRDSARIERAAAPATASGDELPPLRFTSDGALAECPCCASLDVGGAHDTVHCYGCGLSVSAPRPLQNAIDKWNRRPARAAVSAATKPTNYALRVAELEAALFAYVSEFPLNADGDPDVGNIHANIRALKAQVAATKPTADLPDENECWVHIYPSDLKRMERTETHATVFSVAVGRTGEVSVPLYTAEQVQSLLATKPAAAPALAFTEEQVVAAAREWNNRNAVQCGINADDSWAIYGNDCIGDVRAVIADLLAATPAASTIGAAQTAEQVPQTTHQPEKCWSRDEENFSYQSLEDLLDTHDELKPGDTVWVADAVRPDMNRLIDADDVTQTMGERAYDIAGEHAEDYPDVSKEAEDELNALLAGWISKNCAPTFWGVENVRAYVLSDDDCQAATQTTEGASNV